MLLLRRLLEHLYSKLSDCAYVLKRKSFLDSISLEKEEGLFEFIKDKKNHNHDVEHSGEIFHNLKVLKNKIGVVETHLYLLTDDEDWNIKNSKLLLNELNSLLESKKKSL